MRRYLMAVLNLKQISDKLNEEFAGDERRLIFWFDAKAEFVDDIDALELNNAKILHLELHEQLRMKYFLECEDTQTNFSARPQTRRCRRTTLRI